MELVRKFVRMSNIYTILVKSVVNSKLIGEQLHFFLHQRPDANRAILLTGSGRSGTTWIQKVLGTLPGINQIFEPFNPNFVKDIRIMTGWSRENFPQTKSYYLRSDGEYPQWKKYLECVLTGRVRNNWTERIQNDCSPNRYLIKFIRANLILGYIHAHYSPQTIYVIRHPCAVVYSRLRLNWHADVEDILSQEALVEDYLKSWVRYIEKERDLLGSHAVWWAVENLVASNELSNIDHYRVSYEKLCQEPDFYFNDISKWLGYENLALTKDIYISSSRKDDISYSGNSERFSYWRERLSSDQVKRIIDWAHRLGLPWYTEELLPRGLS
jgi:hypothetical protein